MAKGLEVSMMHNEYFLESYYTHSVHSQQYCVVYLKFANGRSYDMGSYAQANHKRDRRNL